MSDERTLETFEQLPLAKKLAVFGLTEEEFNELPEFDRRMMLGDTQ